MGSNKRKIWQQFKILAAILPPGALAVAIGGLAER